MTPLDRLVWLTVVAKAVGCHGPSMAVAAIMADAARADDTGCVCWPGIIGMMARTGLKHDAIIGGIKRLEKAKIISVHRRLGHSNYYHLLMPNQSVCTESVPAESVATDPSVPAESTSRSTRQNQSVPTDTNKKNKERTSKSVASDDAQPPTRVKTPRFSPPTLDEVAAYCEERDRGVDFEKWFNHYTANGWRVGKNPMKDWRAAVRTWEKNSGRRPGEPDANGLVWDGDGKSVDEIKEALGWTEHG